MCNEAEFCIRINRAMICLSLMVTPQRHSEILTKNAPKDGLSGHKNILTTTEPYRPDTTNQLNVSDLFYLLPSGLYRRLRSFTGSVLVGFVP